MIVAVLLIVENILYIFRLNSIFPVWTDREPNDFNQFVYLNALVMLTYDGALIIFTMNYHQAASQVTYLLDEQKKLGQRERTVAEVNVMIESTDKLRKKYNIAILISLILVFIS